MASNTIAVKCQCGSDKFNIHATRRPTDTVSCARCGARGRYGDIMQEARAQAVSVVGKQLKNAFKKAGFKLR